MDEQTLALSAQAGDAQAFTTLTERYRRELFVHCYRMLGSVQDAEDILQEALLKAWARRETYESRASFRAWLYKIATNACLDALRQRRRLGSFEDDQDSAARLEASPSADLRGVEPLSSDLLPSYEPDPEAVVLLRESISMAFMSVLHRLSARQRAILILRDVLNWEAKEVAQFLETTESAVNSALLRAREALSIQSPARHAEQPGKTRLSASGLANLLRRYTDAWQRTDMDALLALVQEDILITMPPVELWYQGLDGLAAFMQVVFSPERAWKLIPMQANGQAAFALYLRLEASQPARYQLISLQICTIMAHSDSEGRIARLDNFLVGGTPIVPEPLPADWLARFGLSAEILE